MPQPRTDSVDAVELLVEMLSELDDAPTREPRSFYDRICETVCRLSSMERAILVLYDDSRRMVVPMGSHSVPEEILDHIYGTLTETPVAQRALHRDEVVQATDMQQGFPGRYSELPGVNMLTCIPISAGGRWLGVIFADKGGPDFDLTEQERHTMWILGKTAALAASARHATRQQDRLRRLDERLELAREVHERVVQKLFGVSLVLGSGQELTQEERERCTAEVQTALSELRETMARSLSPAPRDTDLTLRSELDRLDPADAKLPLEVAWEEGVEVPPQLEPLAVSVLTESLRNASKHAKPTRVDIRVAKTRAGAFLLEVRNDGAVQSAPGAGSRMGLRIAALEALGLGAVVEFGPDGEDGWRVRLVAAPDSSDDDDA